MAKEQFFHPQARELCSDLDTVARRSGVSRDVAFEDWLLAMVCALSAGQLEDQYMDMIQRHAEGAKGKCGCDLMSQMYGKLISAMQETRHDILGDLYTGAITRGQDGQYFTPDAVVSAMASLTVGDVKDDGKRKSVCDPCCGSGRMLMAVAEQHPNWEFVGTDIDLRCVRISALNMALWNRYAWIIWGNSLTLETKLAYRTGFNLNGSVIRQVPIEECPYPVTRTAEGRESAAPEVIESGPLPDGELPTDDPRRGQQGNLF